MARTDCNFWQTTLPAHRCWLMVREPTPRLAAGGLHTLSSSIKAHRKEDTWIEEDGKRESGVRQSDHHPNTSNPSLIRLLAGMGVGLVSTRSRSPQPSTQKCREMSCHLDRWEMLRWQQPPYKTSQRRAYNNTNFFLGTPVI